MSGAGEKAERDLRAALSRIERLACGGLEDGLSANESIIVRAIMHCAQEALDAYAEASA